MAALVATMTAQQARLRGELEVAAETDPLTGLLNRRSFNPLLEALVRDRADLDRPLSMVVLDLDHFKRLNDELGHLEGDRALERFASTLRAQSREGDLVARTGGEEFAVALPGADVTSASAYVRRVATALREQAAIGGVALSTSAGNCAATVDRESAEDLLLQADSALYAAKAAGRCRAARWDGVIEVLAPVGDASAA